MGLATESVGAVSAAIVLVYVLGALLAPAIAPYSPSAADLAARLAPPSAAHWFGTDALGRNVFSRTIYGTRVSLLVGLLTVGLSAATGTALGMAGAHVRGGIDMVGARIVELLQAFPYLIFAIAMMAFLGPGLLEPDLGARAQGLDRVLPPRPRGDARAVEPRVRGGGAGDGLPDVLDSGEREPAEHPGVR
ncbi:MAG TPA: hypothetical protein VFL28_10025 [bacterium]|nr:hypothetical protein [bacterium]